MKMDDDSQNRSDEEGWVRREVSRTLKVQADARIIGRAWLNLPSRRLRVVKLIIEAVM